VRITGLEGSEYIDKVDGSRRKRQSTEAIRFDSERDQVHVNTRSTCTIHDVAWKRRIVVEKTGSESTVVWNPWVEKTAALPDMEPDGWQDMVCVESANVGENAVTLAPGQTQTMSVKITVE
jgi:D-hexose-6-phosphate mutarotase